MTLVCLVAALHYSQAGSNNRYLRKWAVILTARTVGHHLNNLQIYRENMTKILWKYLGWFGFMNSRSVLPILCYIRLLIGQIVGGFIYTPKMEIISNLMLNYSILHFIAIERGFIFNSLNLKIESWKYRHRIWNQMRHRYLVMEAKVLINDTNTDSIAHLWPD